MIRRQKQVLLSLSIFLLAAGAVLFFPVKLENRYTCLYHRIADSGNPVIKGDPLDGSLLKKSREMPHAMQMQAVYMRRYVFFWWFSLLMLTIILIRVFKPEIRSSQRRREAMSMKISNFKRSEEMFHDKTSY